MQKTLCSAHFPGIKNYAHVRLCLVNIFIYAPFIDVQMTIFLEMCCPASCYHFRAKSMRKLQYIPKPLSALLSKPYPPLQYKLE